MSDFEAELKLGFLEEAEQLLADVEQSFLALETDPNDPKIIEKIFRLAHNLKGSAKAVGFDDLGVFTHSFESLLLKIKNGERKTSTAIVSLLLRCTDHIRGMVATYKSDLGAKIDCSALLQELEQAIAGQLAGEDSPKAEPEAAVAAPEPAPADEDIIRPEDVAPILQNEAESDLLAVESPTPVAVQATPKAAPPAGAPGAPAAAADESIRVSLSRLEKLINYVGELVILQTVLKEQSANSNPILFRKTIHQLGKVTKEIQDLSMSLRMVPIKQTFQKMQRIVRDTANLLNKKISLTLVGEETELDKTVLEHISDPLVHLIRNACDHGIENPADRAAKGKSEGGNVILSAYHQGDRLVIEVKDDGGGIDPERLKNKAIEKGILKPGTTMSEQDAVHLIFHPGFSTKAQVTEVSGRGVGMDVVKTNIEQLQGEIVVNTSLNQGSVFKIYLPLTLAIIDAMIVKSGADRFAIPLAHVHESVQPEQQEIHRSAGLGEALVLRGETLPLFRLSSLLGRKSDPDAQGISIIVRAQGPAFAVLVDDILGQNQIVIKKLSAELAHLKGFSGSAILGDGKPALILELTELIKLQAKGKNQSSEQRRVAA